MWSSREGLDQFQSSLVFHDRLLQGATSVLSELYGIGSAVDDTEEKDEFDGTETGEDVDAGKILPNRPLSIDNVAQRVGELVSIKTEDFGPSACNSFRQYCFFEDPDSNLEFFIHAYERQNHFWRKRGKMNKSQRIP